MKKLFLFFFLFSVTIKAQELKAYQFYNKQAEPVDFGQMIGQLKNYHVILFGEYHNNAMVHWLQLKTTEALYAEKDKKLILGAEMFERDNQSAIDLYLKDSIDAEQLHEQVRLWSNFDTDYKPLLDFAKTHQLKFIATNIPRRYAAIVAQSGQDSLNAYPKEERKFMAKLPVEVDMETPGYIEILDMMKDHEMNEPEGYVVAQALKDATMAESIYKNSNRRHLFLHFNGDYHSKAYGGIYWYLKNKKKRWKIAVISVGESDEKNLPLPEDMKLTEFNLIIPKDMSKTY
ncbi:MAG TPA: ChaN family lipoprotein [Flavobacteriaceae bacterium]|nr:ChaN family lipoprotein [Flavobacteriaceae bacterium]